MFSTIDVIIRLMKIYHFVRNSIYFREKPLC